MGKRKTAIGSVNQNYLNMLQELPIYFELNVSISGISDEIEGFSNVYNAIYKKYKNCKIGMGKYGFATLEEAEKSKSVIEQIIRSKGYTPIITIQIHAKS